MRIFRLVVAVLLAGGTGPAPRAAFAAPGWSVVASADSTIEDGLASTATNGAITWAVGATAPANSTASQTLTELHS